MFAIGRRRSAAVLAVAVVALLAASGTSSADSGQPWQNRSQPPLTVETDVISLAFQLSPKRDADHQTVTVPGDANPPNASNIR